MEATLPRLVRPTVACPDEIRGEGLVLRPWDIGLVRQMAGWRQRGFPFHGFDLGHLADPVRAANALASVREPGPHRHFVAVEQGRAVGRASINLQDVSGLYLWAVHVPPEEEGHGVCRRMLATLMTWFEDRYPETPFVLSSNSFNDHAHRAYYALGFEVVEARWHYDRELAERLWRVTPSERQPIAHHIRFQTGRWEVRTFVFARPPGAPMQTGQRPR